jgi:hypothetical protein
MELGDANANVDVAARRRKREYATLGDGYGGVAFVLYEATVLGMAALRLAGWQSNPHLRITVTVRSPETTHTISNAILSAWLSRNGKTPKEQALKARLRDLLQTARE